MNNTPAADQTRHAHSDGDPFAGIEDDTTATQPLDVRIRYLNRARRGYGELHRDWIQKPSTETSRPSKLSELVTNRRESALEAMLMLHSLEPVLRNCNWLSMNTWSALLTKGHDRPMTPNAASKAFRTLEDMSLVSRRRDGHHTIIEPLAEDGSGVVWQRPGERDVIGQGYFTLPFAYWTEEYSSKLTLPAKAVLLILLSATQKTPSVSIAIDRFPEWYGISERSAERGYNQLESEGVLAIHRQRVRNDDVVGGWNYVYHRALLGPFSTASRQQLQKTAQTAGSARRAKATTPEEVIDSESTIASGP